MFLLRAKMMISSCTVLLGLTECLRAEGSSGSPYPGDPGQAIAAILIFLLLLWVLGKWVWKPIIKQLKARENRIAETIQEAEKHGKEAKELLILHQQQLEDAKGQAEELLEGTRREAAELKDSIIFEAREEAGKSIRRAKEEIGHAREEAMREMREMTAQLAMNIAGKVLQRDITHDEQGRLMHQSMEDIRESTSGES